MFLLNQSRNSSNRQRLAQYVSVLIL